MLFLVCEAWKVATSRIFTAAVSAVKAGGGAATVCAVKAGRLTSFPYSGRWDICNWPRGRDQHVPKRDCPSDVVFGDVVGDVVFGEVVHSDAQSDALLEVPQTPLKVFEQSVRVPSEQYVNSQVWPPTQQASSLNNHPASCLH